MVKISSRPGQGRICYLKDEGLHAVQAYLEQVWGVEIEHRAGNGSGRPLSRGATGTRVV